MGRIIALPAGAETVELVLDGRAVRAVPGESIAGMLLAQGIRSFRRSQSGAGRAPYCGMGTCFECRVSVQRPGAAPLLLRACVTPVEPGMVIVTLGGGLP